MGEVEHLGRGWDHVENLRRTLKDLQGGRTVVHELIQNADDAASPTMTFVITDDRLEVRNASVFTKCSDVRTGECLWLNDEAIAHRCDFHSFRKIGSGDKRSRPGTTGAFGIGFTAVYQLTDHPELISNGEHWTLDELAPDGKRITRREAGSEVRGTTFLLPWARDDSEFRRRIGQPVVTEESIERLRTELVDEIPRSMPFLHHLDVAEVDLAGEVLTFRRSASEDGIVTVKHPTGADRWWIAADHFEDRGRQLESAHRHLQQGRLTEAAIAFPLDAPTHRGQIYATLPTELPAHLPVLLNSSFYPASDRKRVPFDDSAEGEWNRAALECQAGVLRGCLPRLPAIIGDEALVDLLLAARDLAARADGVEVDVSFGHFWQEVIAELGDQSVVPTASGAYGSPRSVRLWSDDRELAAMAVLGHLGIELVAATVREKWISLRHRDVGNDFLRLAQVADALLTSGLSSERPARDWPPWATSDGIDRLWALLDFLLIDRSSAEAKQRLGTVALAPTWSGALCRFDDARALGQSTQDLLDDWALKRPCSMSSVSKNSRSSSVRSRMHLRPKSRSGSRRRSAAALAPTALTPPFRC